jgi:hypothetical protein
MKKQDESRTMETYNIRYLNAYIPNKFALYEILKGKDYYLPKFDTKCITEEYLLGVAKKEFFSIKKGEVRIGYPKRSVNAADIVTILKEITGKPLGFDQFTLPDIEWLTNVLFSLKPDHHVFTKPDEIEFFRSFPPGLLFPSNLISWAD